MVSSYVASMYNGKPFHSFVQSIDITVFTSLKVIILWRLENRFAVRLKPFCGFQARFTLLCHVDTANGLIIQRTDTDRRREALYPSMKYFSRYCWPVSRICALKYAETFRVLTFLVQKSFSLSLPLDSFSLSSRARSLYQCQQTNKRILLQDFFFFFFVFFWKLFERTERKLLLIIQE